MNNKLNNMINDFLKQYEGKSEEELNEALGEFMMKYNNNDIEYENTPLDNAYEILEQAENAKTEKEAIRLAKKAFKTSDACFDAVLFQVDLEDDSLKRNKMLDEGLDYEKKRLEKEGYFKKDNIGHFYGIFETRPYIRGLHTKANFLSMEGKLTKAKEVCEEILRLNENDNTGARYLLMTIYAMLEDEKSILKLYDKYKEENLGMLIPLFAIYYKLENDEKACFYLNKINKKNPYFLKMYQGKLELDPDNYSGYYSMGDESELYAFIEESGFLMISMPGLSEYVVEKSKKK